MKIELETNLGEENDCNTGGKEVREEIERARGKK